MSCQQIDNGCDAKAKKVLKICMRKNRGRERERGKKIRIARKPLFVQIHHPHTSWKIMPFNSVRVRCAAVGLEANFSLDQKHLLVAGLKKDLAEKVQLQARLGSVLHDVAKRS